MATTNLSIMSRVSEQRLNLPQRPLPNKLYMEKKDYIKACLIGRQMCLPITSTAMNFYHCEVPLEEAQRYLNVLEAKLFPAGSMSKQGEYK